MTLTRANLGPAARAYYDANTNRQTVTRPRYCPRCKGVKGNTACVLCRGSGFWNPLPSAQQPEPKPLAAQSAMASAKTKTAQRGEKADAALFLNLCEKAGLPKPETEFRFHPTRKWRMDFAWPQFLTCLEQEGAVWTNGRHTRGAGFLADIEKYNAAARMGYLVLRCTPQTLLTVEIIEDVRMAMRNRRR